MHAAVYEAIDQHVGNHRDVHIDGHPTCPCGQELDTCRRAHCPRCGHRLSQPQAEAQTQPRWHVA